MSLCSKVRDALDYVNRDLKLDRPLLSPKFHTDGVDLFVEELKTLLKRDDARVQLRGKSCALTLSAFVAT